MVDRYAASSRPKPSDQLHVLVVDDEPRLRTMLAEALRSFGIHTTTTAATAEEGLRILAQTPVDILLLDLNLPAMDGLTMLAKARQQHDDLAVIILTAFGTLDAAQQAIRHRVADFLTKPVMLGDLEQAIGRAHLWLNGESESIAAGEASQRAREQSAADNEAGSAALDLSKPTTIAEAELQLIQRALQRHQGNRSAAAEELGISRRTLYSKLKLLDEE